MNNPSMADDIPMIILEEYMDTKPWETLPEK